MAHKCNFNRWCGREKALKSSGTSLICHACHISSINNLYNVAPTSQTILSRVMRQVKASVLLMYLIVNIACHICICCQHAMQLLFCSLHIRFYMSGACRLPDGLKNLSTRSVRLSANKRLSEAGWRKTGTWMEQLTHYWEALSCKGLSHDLRRSWVQLMTSVFIADRDDICCPDFYLGLYITNSYGLAYPR